MPPVLKPFADARPLYRRGAHPRVMLGPDDLKLLREQVKRGAGRKIMTALRRKVGLLCDEMAPVDDVAKMLEGDGSHNSLAARIGYAASDIALVAATDQNADLERMCLRLLETVVQPSDRPSRLGVAGAFSLFDLLHDRLPEDLRAAYVAAAGAHARKTHQAGRTAHFFGAGGNMTIGRNLSLIPMILAVMNDPGADDFTEVLAWLIKAYEASLHTALAPSGYPEEDIGYGTGVGGWLVEKGLWLKRAGLFDAFAACPRLPNFGEAILHFVQPWGEELSNTGDHGDDFQNRELVLARLAQLTGNPALLWLSGTLHYHHGKVHPVNTLPDFYVEVPLRKGVRTPASARSLLALGALDAAVHPRRLKPQPETAFCDPRRGLVSFRSGWNDDATFVVFDGSQRCTEAQGHFHASCGHFSLSAAGEYFSIDTGRYNNEQTCHSVALIDGKPGRTNDGEWRQMSHHGLLTGFTPGPFVDTASVDSSLQHNCMWARRTLGLVKGKQAPAWVWVVDDINKANDWAEYWWQLQSAPENVITTRKSDATIRGFRQGNLLDVAFAVPDAKEYARAHTLRVEQDLGTASAFKYLNNDIAGHVRQFDRPRDTVHGPVYERPRLLAKVAGLNGRMLAVMTPRAKGEPKAKVRRLACLPRSLAVSVTFEQVEDTLIFSFEHGLLEAGDIVGRGHWCVVRRDRETGRVLDHALGEGESLRVAGRAIKV